MTLKELAESLNVSEADAAQLVADNEFELDELNPSQLDALKKASRPGVLSNPGLGLTVTNSGITQSHKIDRKLQTGHPAPITRAERLELQRANQINLGAHVQAGSDSRNRSASEFIQSEVAKIDVAIDLAEAEQARDLVDRVIPAYAEWRIGQSPARIANHIEAYGQEVAESLLPQFRSFSEVLSTELSEVADEVIRGFGAA